MRRPGVGGGLPALPPSLDPAAFDAEGLGGGQQGLPPGFKLPKLDFGKLTRRDPRDN